MRTLLVLRAAGLGDLLVTVPALRGLRRRFPGHHLVLATPAALAPIAHRTGVIDEVLPTGGPDALAWPGADPPDVAVNLHGVGPQSHRALDATRPRQRIGLRAPGWAGPDWADVARAHHHERERWCAVVEALGVPADPTDLALPRSHTAGDGLVVVHPGAAYEAKCWPADRQLDVLVPTKDRPIELATTLAGLAAQVGVRFRVGFGVVPPPERWLAYKIACRRVRPVRPCGPALEAGGFDFWSALPSDAHGEDVLAQLRVMARRGGAGILPSGAYHQQSPTSIPHRSRSAVDILAI